MSALEKRKKRGKYLRKFSAEVFKHARIIKTRFEISRLARTRDQRLRDLGQRCFRLIRAKKLEVPELEKIFQDLEGLGEQLDIKEKELRAIILENDFPEARLLKEASEDVPQSPSPPPLETPPSPPPAELPQAELPEAESSLPPPDESSSSQAPTPIQPEPEPEPIGTPEALIKDATLPSAAEPLPPNNPAEVEAVAPIEPILLDPSSPEPAVSPASVSSETEAAMPMDYNPIPEKESDAEAVSGTSETAAGDDEETPEDDLEDDGGAPQSNQKQQRHKPRSGSSKKSKRRKR